MTDRVSGLSDANAAEARRVVLLGAELLMGHQRAVHYSQDAIKRWEGIRKRLRIADDEFPANSDCSSCHTWLLWNALTHVGASRDTVNGMDWRSGYTGTIATHGKLVRDVRNAKVGDAVLYGYGWPYKHVATYIGGGRCFSHGGEAGPFIVGIDYRPDRAMIRRNI